MSLKYSITIILIFLSYLGYGQSFYSHDSLKQKTYSELYDKSYEYLEASNNQIAEKYIKAYLFKAKKENDSIQISNAFFIINWLYNPQDIRSLTALDSSIYYNKNTRKGNGNEVIYNRRALVYNDRADLNNALSDYLTGLKYAKENNNTSFIFIIKHNIAILQRKLGKYEEAKNLFNECLAYEEIDMVNKKDKWDTIHYLQTLAETVSAYRLNKQLDSAKILNKAGIKLSKNLGIDVLFDLNDGILAYHDHEYLTAKHKLKKVLPRLKGNNFIETYNQIETNLFLGKSVKNLGSEKEAISYFKKVDSISDNLNYFVPENRLAYIELIDYYKSKNDNRNQLVYINKLLSADSILTSNYKIVGKQLFDDFDAKELVEDKERIISYLEQENDKISIQNIIITFLLIISLFGIAYYYYRQRLYKKRFFQLLNKNRNDKEDNKPNDNQSGSSSINKETLNNLLDKLQEFEEKKEYLNTNINSKDLAKSFGSNSTYLSKAINTFKEKSFSNYINDLRVNFIIDKLKEDSIYRKYTVKAIAQEIGFNNSEAFSKAFYKKTGIYPSYFIKELEKQP
ncbi:AraC family transcriptional regulator [uncultured Aquimarina sp.]|uniref:AraC family transcriptional regulator n=1 Tax=uncultured Aquimarina sp. TaxID=575652 RepID=UPI00262CAC76|nr:AraC family transcriptional regulator [uncultured Aquimarina sp.]